MPANRRWDAKRDKSEPKIVEALKSAGYDVFRELPVDLAVRRSYWEPGVVLLIEAKTPQKRGGIRKRKDQEKQDAVLKQCGIRRVTTPAQALDVARGINVEGDEHGL